MEKVARDDLDKKKTVSSYMYYNTVNLSPSVIIRDAVIVKWAVMQ